MEKYGPLVALEDVDKKGNLVMLDVDEDLATW